MPHATDLLYTALTGIVPAEVLAARDCLRLTSGSFMDLVVEVLARRGQRLTLSLAHYFTQNGDLVPDPDMEVEVDLAARTVRPLAIQTQAYFVRAVDHDDEGHEVVHTGRQRELRSFLAQWLSNLKSQGFHWVSEPEAAAGDAP